MSKVSVIIPTYNRNRIVKEAIESVLRQSYTDFELIIVDDGSTDNTQSVISSINDTRIRYFYKINGGQSSAINLGLSESTGYYVAFLDSDDLWPEKYLETMVSSLEKNRDFSGAYAPIKVTCTDGQKKDLNNPKRNRSGWLTQQYFDLSPCLLPSTTFFLKSAWDGIYWDEAIHHGNDYDVFLRISTKIKFLFVSQVQVIKRDQFDSVSVQLSSVGAIYAAYILERFYFSMCGKKYISLRKAKTKISRRYRQAAQKAYEQNNFVLSVKLFKKAMNYRPFNIQLYLKLLKAWLRMDKRASSSAQMPDPLPPYITAFGKQTETKIIGRFELQCQNTNRND